MLKYLYRLCVIAGSLAALGVLASIVSTLPDRPSYINPVYAQSTAPSPNVTALTVGTSATMGAIPALSVVRALCIANGNATGTNTITVTWGTLTPVSGTTGLVIPGGQVAASTWCAPSIINLQWSMAQLNAIAVASTSVTVLQW